MLGLGKAKMLYEIQKLFCGVAVGMHGCVRHVLPRRRYLDLVFCCSFLPVLDYFVFVS